MIVGIIAVIVTGFLAGWSFAVTTRAGHNLPAAQLESRRSKAGRKGEVGTVVRKRRKAVSVIASAGRLANGCSNDNHRLPRV